MGHLEDFGLKVKENLDQASWLDRRDILRTLVKRIEIGKTHITVVFRVGPSPGVVGPRLDVLQDCRPRVDVLVGFIGFDYQNDSLLWLKMDTLHRRKCRCFL